MNRLPKPRAIFRLGRMKVERTDYKRGRVYDLSWRWFFVSVGRKHFRLSVWWGK